MKQIPVVAGLVMKMHYPNTEALIGGPALYAAIGMRLMKVKPRIMSGISSSIDKLERKLISTLSYDDLCINWLEMNSLIWSSNKILGNKGNGKIDGMSNRWVSERNTSLLNEALLVLANGDPSWYCSVLSKTKPRLVIMDFNMNWLIVRERELRKCLHYVNIITLTKFEYNVLGRGFFNVFLQQNNKYILLKDGKNGAELLSSDKRELLEPAKPQSESIDVGCGDLLIGVLAGHLYNQLKRNESINFQKIKEGYLLALPWLAILIESKSNESFLRRCLNECN